MAMVLLALGCAPGCATHTSFEEVTELPSTPVEYALENLPFSEYWMYIRFNGKKQGFTRLRISPSKENDGEYELLSDAVMRFQLLGVEKTTVLKGVDWVRPDLSLVRFHYDYEIDGKALEVSGRVNDGRLEIEILDGAETIERVVALRREIYPSSATGLYPILNGLGVGEQYSYSLFDGQAQRIVIVIQRILGYEQGEGLDGAALRIQSEYHGQEVNTWIDSSGRPVLEKSMGGIFVAALEDAARARREFTLAALNKDDFLLDFSKVPSDQSIDDPRRVSALMLSLKGVPDDMALPWDSLQGCERRTDEVLCGVIVTDSSATLAEEDATEDVSAYLTPTFAVPSDEPRILELAADIAGDSGNTIEQIASLVEWIQKRVTLKASEVSTAIDVLDRRRARAQGRAFLYAAFARALGIATRVVNGIVYTEQAGGFVYHTWAESHSDGRWVRVDPTLGQVNADATHVKLVEGEDLSDLAPLTDLIGRLKVQISAFESSAE